MPATTVERVATERMILTRIRPQDAEDLFALHRDPRVARTMSASGRPPTDAAMAQSLSSMLRHWEQHGFGVWLLRDRTTGSAVGRGGLQHTIVDGRDEVEVGWTIVPERWREGLATEMAHAAVRAAFEDLKLPEIVAFTLPANVASRRVMEKSGFTFEREIVHAALPHVLYRQTRAASAGTVATLP